MRLENIFAASFDAKHTAAVSYDTDTLVLNRMSSASATATTAVVDCFDFCSHNRKRNEIHKAFTSSTLEMSWRNVKQNGKKAAWKFQFVHSNGSPNRLQLAKRNACCPA